MKVKRDLNCIASDVCIFAIRSLLIYLERVSISRERQKHILARMHIHAYTQVCLASATHLCIMDPCKW